MPNHRFAAPLFALLFAAATAVSAAPALDDAGTIVTVMQFSAKDAASRAELVKRMAAMRDYQRSLPGYIENAVMENRNPGAKPHFVGIARWKSLKDWEALWAKDDFQKLVKSINEVGEVSPGTYSAVK